MPPWKEGNAAYDIDGNGPKKYNSGQRIKDRMRAYKVGKGTNFHMEQLIRAMHLSLGGNRRVQETVRVERVRSSPFSPHRCILHTF